MRSRAHHTAARAACVQFAAPKAVMDDLVAKGQTLDLPYVVTKLRGMGHTVVPVPSAGVNCSTMRTADESDQRITCVVYLGGQGSRGRGRRSGPGAQLVSVRARSRGAAAPARRRRDCCAALRLPFFGVLAQPVAQPCLRLSVAASALRIRLVSSLTRSVFTALQDEAVLAPAPRRHRSHARGPGRQEPQ